MPNIASVKKDVKKSEKNHLRNVDAKSSTKTFVKKARVAIETGAAKPITAEAIRLACKALDKTAERGIIHRNQASRRKSRLMKQANKASLAEAPMGKEFNHPAKDSMLEKRSENIKQGGGNMPSKTSVPRNQEALDTLSMAFDSLVLGLEPKMASLPTERKELVDGLIALTDLWSRTQRKDVTSKDRENLGVLTEHLREKSVHIARSIGKDKKVR